MGLRWGIVGYGWVAHDFMLPAIAASGGRVIAVADTSSVARDRAQADGLTAYQTVIELLNAVQLDAVYVATPNNHHAEAVIELARSGMPILCEKPLAATLDDAEAMYAAVKEHNVMYGTAFDQRHHPAHRAMHDMVQAGDMGVPISVRIVYACWLSPTWITGAQTVNWRVDPQAAGGGAVIDLALHGLDLVQMLLDEPLQSLSITLQRRIHNYAVDDGGMLTARSAGGVLVSQHVAYNYAEVLPRRRLEILCEAGMLTAIDTMGQTSGGSLSRHCGRTGNMTSVPFDMSLSPFVAQARAFTAAVKGMPHDFSIERDIALVRLFDAAYQEARSCL